MLLKIHSTTDILKLQILAVINLHTKMCNLHENNMFYFTNSDNQKDNLKLYYCKQQLS